MQRRERVNDESGEGTPNQIRDAIPKGGVHRHADYAVNVSDAEGQCDVRGLEDSIAADALVMFLVNHNKLNL